MKKIFYIVVLLAVSSCADLEQEQSDVNQDPCGMQRPENYAKCIGKKSARYHEQSQESSTPQSDTEKK